MKNIYNENLHPFNSLNLYGHKDLFNNLINLYNNQNFPKVLLLSGAKGSGKLTLVFHAINYFFSINSEFLYDVNNFKINENNNFYKNLNTNIDQNFFYYDIEQKKIGIEEIRSLKNKLNKAPLNSTKRFIIIDDADQLNENTSNALLKTIEEPSSLNYFILIDNKKGNLIETIRSRCLELKVFLNELKINEITQNLFELHKVKLPDYLLDNLRDATPGFLIKYSFYTKDLDFKFTDSTDIIGKIFLDSFRKNKDYFYIDCFKFLLNLKMKKTINQNNSNIISLLYENSKILDLLNKIDKIPISNNSVLNTIRTYSGNVGK